MLLKDWNYTKYKKRKTILLREYIGDATTVVVPAKHYQFKVVVAKRLFKDNQKITKVVFEEETKIQFDNMEEMFYNCLNLREVPTIPAKVINCKDTFYNCDSLIAIPNIPKAALKQLS